MRNLNKKLENKTVDYQKLLNYGFKKEKNKYIYKKNICDNTFKVIIEISKEKKLSKVIDLETNEEYIVVDVKDSSGNFVGKVKEEYENIINDIIEKCTSPNVFKSKQSKEVIKYIEEKYNDHLEYLWEKFPNNAICRNKQNNKWYCLILIINENKLGIESDKEIEIIDLRYPKERIDVVVDNETIFPGYHMNKKSWITLKLDDKANINEIYNLIDLSYKISLKK